MTTQYRYNPRQKSWDTRNKFSLPLNVHIWPIFSLCCWKKKRYFATLIRGDKGIHDQYSLSVPVTLGRDCSKLFPKNGVVIGKGYLVQTECSLLAHRFIGQTFMYDSNFTTIPV